MRWWVWRGSCRLPGSPNGVPGRAGASPSSWSSPGRETISSPWVARVQVTARRPNAELNSSSCDAPVSGWIATVIPFVWPCQESTVERHEVASRSRPCFVAQPLDRVGGVVDGLVAGGQDRDERVARASSPGSHASMLAGGRSRRRRSSRCSSAKPAANSSSSSYSTNSISGRSTSAASASASPSTSSSVGTPVPTCSRRRRRRRSSSRATSDAVARGGDAVELAPLRVERAPQRELPGGRAPDGRQLARPGPRVVVVVGRPRAVRVVAGVAAPRVRADLERRQLADVADADPDRRGLVTLSKRWCGSCHASSTNSTSNGALPFAAGAEALSAVASVRRSRRACGEVAIMTSQSSGIVACRGDARSTCVRDVVGDVAVRGPC